MPIVQFESPDIMPLPSLRTYTTVSVLLVATAVFYGLQTTEEPDWRLNTTLSAGSTDGQTNHPEGHDDSSNPLIPLIPSGTNETFLQLGLFLEHPAIVRIVDVSYVLLHEPLCVWALINIAYCGLLLIGKCLQSIVFGDLRVSERQLLKERFWNFVFYKFIFVFGVLNVQMMDEVVLWCAWFTVLGFLSLFTQVCRDRIEYLSFSPSTSRSIHVRLLLLLSSITVCGAILVGVSVAVGLHSGFTTFAFMVAECLLVLIRSAYVLSRHLVYLWDTNHEGVWENCASVTYYSELIFELGTLAIDFVHHVHMLCFGNVVLSMASFVIVMQLRFLLSEVKRRVRKHQNYLHVVHLMNVYFPIATSEELGEDSTCAICWDKMNSARRLPCGHLFHNSCLRSWLEQDTSCPTCRNNLKTRPDEEGDGREGEGNNRLVTADHAHFFHFDGSRYASWLPTVSVEVSRPRLYFGRLNTFPADESVDSRQSLPLNPQLEVMVEQVHEWFPNILLDAILDDLRVTRSVGETMDNILDGRVTSITPELEWDESLVDVQEDIVNESSSSQEETTSCLPTTSTGEPGICRSFSGRFSKSSEERERILNERKNELLLAARQSFLLKNRVQTENHVNLRE